MRNIISIIILICAGTAASGQPLLTMEQAKEITLDNNFGIRIGYNNIAAAENQTDMAANGYLPTVSASGGLNTSLGGASQKFNNGQEASTSNAFTWGGNASVRADYAVYDKRRDLTLAQLKESLTLTNLQLRQTIEQNLLNVYNIYYLVAQLQENVSALKEAIEVSRERLRRASYQLELGQGNGLNVLNAKVDIQRDSVNLLNALVNLDNEKRNLNVAMGRDATLDFIVLADTGTDAIFALEELIAQSQTDNIGLKINEQDMTVNRMNLQLIDAESKPTVSTGLSYDFNYTDNPSGAFIDQSNSRGLAANVGINWTIFDGSRKIRRQNAVLGLTNQKLQRNELLQQLERDIVNTWYSYQNALYVIDVEMEALQTNEENFARTQEQVSIGQLTSIEFRQAQLNLLTAQINLNNARFSAKVLEIQMLQLAGRLIE